MSDDASSSVADDLELALCLADEASAVALHFFRRGVTPGQKADGSVVTEADVEVERMLSAALASQRPSDAVLGEELGAVGDAPRRWILDPIDGTMNFVAGRPDWGVHIALESDGEVVVGVVTRPVLGQRWWASRGGGAYIDGLVRSDVRTSLEVSRREKLDGARVSGWLFDDDPVKARLRSLPSWVEPLDLDTIMRVAEGELEAFVDGTASQIWDRAPFVILVEEAGGRYRDRTGGRDLSLPGGLFTNGHVDAQLDEFLAI